MYYAMLCYAFLCYTICGLLDLHQQSKQLVSHFPGLGARYPVPGTSYWHQVHCIGTAVLGTKCLVPSTGYGVYHVVLEHVCFHCVVFGGIAALLHCLVFIIATPLYSPPPPIPLSIRSVSTGVISLPPTPLYRVVFALLHSHCCINWVIAAGVYY